MRIRICKNIRELYVGLESSPQPPSLTAVPRGCQQAEGPHEASLHFLIVCDRSHLFSWAGGRVVTLRP